MTKQVIGTVLWIIGWGLIGGVFASFLRQRMTGPAKSAGRGESDD